MDEYNEMVHKEIEKVLLSAAEASDRDNDGIRISIIDELHKVQELRHKNEGIFDKSVSDALLVAEACMTKQIPVGVYVEGDGYADGFLVYDTAYCQTCGHLLTEDFEPFTDQYPYCPRCSQALLWPKYNDEED